MSGYTKTCGYIKKSNAHRIVLHQDGDAARAAIAGAIASKGGTVASGDGFEEFASDVGTIPSGSGGNTPEYLKGPEIFIARRTSEWIEKPWVNTSTGFYVIISGSNVWTDGENFYYS